MNGILYGMVSVLLGILSGVVLKKNYLELFSKFFFQV